MLIYDLRSSKWDTAGVIVSKTPSGSYRVRVEGGNVLRRARIHLRAKYPPLSSEGSGSSTGAAADTPSYATANATSNADDEIDGTPDNDAGAVARDTPSAARPQEDPKRPPTAGQVPTMPTSAGFPPVRRSGRPSVKPRRLIDEVHAPVSRRKK